MLAHLEAENAYTKASLADTEQLQRDLAAELRARIQEADETAPVRWAVQMGWRLVCTASATSACIAQIMQAGGLWDLLQVVASRARLKHANSAADHQASVEHT